MLKIKIGEIFYLAFWMIMILAKGMGLYEGMWQYTACLAAAFLCLLIKLVLTEYCLRDLLWAVPCGILGLWINFHSKDQSALILAAVMIGLKDVKMPRVFLTGAFTWGACFIFMNLKYFIYGETGPIRVDEKLGLGPVMRWSMGFTHPNVFHVTYAVLTALILYCWNLKKGRKQLRIAALLMLGNLYVFLYSVSFTGFILTTLVIAADLYLVKRKKLVMMEKILVLSVLPVCLVFSLLLPLVLDRNSGLFQRIDDILNYRYSATKIYLDVIGPSFWGKQLVLGYGAIDCSYTEAFLSYGGVAFSLLMFGYICVIYDMVRRKKWKELVVMIPLLAGGVSEPFLFNASFKNITVLFLGEYLYARSSNIEKASVLNTEISLLSGWNRCVEIPVKKGKLALCRLKDALCKYKYQMAAVGAVSFLLIAGGTAMFVRMPESIYVGNQATDCGDLEEKFLDLENLPENFNSDVYVYSGPDSVLYEFEGNIIKVEYVRKITGYAVWGTIAVLFVSALAMGGMSRAKSEE